jgi:hypothetical protein
MRAMRTLAILIVLLGISGVENSIAGDELFLADAADAAIGVPGQRITIADHYGDPDGFMKYIIRKPPVLA